MTAALPAELVGILRQIALAVAGAACLWGFVFFVRGGLWREFASVLLRPFAVATTAAVAAWIALGWLLPPAVQAHEGISLAPSGLETLNARVIDGPLIFLLLAALLVGSFIAYRRPELLTRRLGTFYAVLFVLISVLIMLPEWGADGHRRLFFALHGWHSILTLGTVIIIDFLLFLPNKTWAGKRALFGYFPIMSRVIWTGLGIDFLASMLIINEGLILTPRFYFAQTVVGIIILNGALLSGLISKMLSESAVAQRPLAPVWQRIALLSGVVSIVSWTSITAADGLRSITLPYLALMSVYVMIVILGWLSATLLARFFPHFRVG